MADVSTLENKLNDVFGKQAPKMPDGGVKFFVQWLPLIVLIVAILNILSALALWRSVHQVNELVGLANQLSKTYGGETVSTSNVTLWVWLAIGFVVIESILYFLAYSPLKAHHKKGWDYLLYASLLSVAYSVVTLFIDGKGVGALLMGLIGTAIGWWILFQIRPAYLGKHSEPTAPQQQ
jgi:uncharacterized BrkB/YihY/UPF0761 family membrane protein